MSIRDIDPAYPAYPMMHLRRDQQTAIKPKEIKMDSGVSRELPRYRSHKTVWALKIAKLQVEPDGSALIIPAEDGYGPIGVNRTYVNKHEPKVGGYYVQYEDGYTSFSPASAFESGYTRL